MSAKVGKEDARQLRKRPAKSLRDANPELDALLGIDAHGKALTSARPDIAQLRRKLERSCPAASFSRAVAPNAVLSTLQAEGFRRPLVVRAAAAGSADATRAALGIRLPLQAMSPRGMVAAVGPDIEVPTFDVGTQESGPRMTVRQLADYFEVAPDARGRLINVVSFSLADTRLHTTVEAPEAARCLDLVSQVWPQPCKTSPTSAAKQTGKFVGEGSGRPETLLYALMGPQGAYTDWHVDMGGSAVWYHIVSGAKIFMAAPNTAENVAAYEAWSSSARQSTTFLGESLEGCVRIVLRAGDTLFLPSGWPHAVSTPEDSFVLGGNFLHSLDYGSIAAVLRTERRMGVGPRFQFPAWRELLWRAATDAAARAKASAPAAATSVAKSPKRRAGAARGRPELSRWEREGIPSLVRVLRSGTAAEAAPREIEDPEGLLDELDRMFGTAKSPVGAEKGAPAKKRPRRTEPSESDCSGNSDEEERGLAPTRDPRLPEKRAKQAATLAALKAARSNAGQPKRVSNPVVLDSEESEPDSEETPSSSDASLGIDLGFESSEEEEEEGTVGTDGQAVAEGSQAGPALWAPPSGRDTPTKSRDPRIRPPGAPAPAPVPAPAASRVKLADRAGKVRQKPALLPVSVDAKPPGRRVASAAQEQPSGSTAAAAAAGDNGPRAAALREVAALRKMESELRRDERLLAGVASGLKDAGQKLQARVAEGRARVEAKTAQLQGRVLYFVDADGHRQGPFTSRQLGALVQAGRCPQDGTAQRVRADGRLEELSVVEAVALPEPDTAVVLREERERAAAAAAEAAAAAAAAAAPPPPPVEVVETPSQEVDEKRVKKDRLSRKERKEARAKGRTGGKKAHQRPGSREGGAPSESPRSSNKRRSRWEDRPPSSASTAHPPPGSRFSGGPSAWSIAAAAAEAVAAQESAVIWTYKEPGSGRMAGPYSTAELRSMFAAGSLTQDLMVHDEDEGCSISLYALLGVARGGGAAAGGDAVPPEPTAAEEALPPPPPPPPAVGPVIEHEPSPPPPPPPPPVAAAAPLQQSLQDREREEAAIDFHQHHHHHHQQEMYASAPEPSAPHHDLHGNGYGGGYQPSAPAPQPPLHAPLDDFGQYGAPAPYQYQQPPQQQPMHAYSQQQPAWGPPPGPPPMAPPPPQAPAWPGQQLYPPPAPIPPPQQYAPSYAAPPPMPALPPPPMPPHSWGPPAGPPEHRPMMRAAPPPMLSYGMPPPQHPPPHYGHHPQGGEGPGFPPPPRGGEQYPPQPPQHQQQPYYPPPQHQQQYSHPPPQYHHRNERNERPRGRGRGRGRGPPRY